MSESSSSDFSKYYRILHRRWIIATVTIGTVLGLVAIYALVKKPVYRVSGQLRYEQINEASPLLGAENSSQRSPSSGWDLPERTMTTELRVILSEPVLNETLQLVNQKFPNETVAEKIDSIDELRDKITVVNPPDTNLVKVSYDGINPKFSVELIDSLMASYLNKNLQTNRENSIKIRKFISSQIPEIRKNIFLKDLALRQFKEHYKLTDLDVDTKKSSADLGRIDQQIDETKSLLSDANSQVENIRKKTGLAGKSALSTSVVSQSKSIQGAQADLQLLERQLDQARAQYQLNHPVVLSLQDKVNSARKFLESSISAQSSLGNSNLSSSEIGPTQQDLLDTLIKAEVTQKSLSDRLLTLNSLRSKYANQNGVLPTIEQHFHELERDLKGAESTYEALLKSLQEVQVIENQTIGNIHVIEPAQVPKDPIAPNKPVALTAGLVAALMLAGALVYLSEIFDSRIYEVEEMREILPFPLLGTVPKFSLSDLVSGENLQLPVLSNPFSTSNESFRTIQANIKFLSSDKPVKIITISSAIPGEGKSTVSANLALSISQLGHRVLLVDCDLRGPTQHAIWQITNATGLSNVLVGQISNGIEIQHYVTEKLDVITSGMLPPNPYALIDSQHMIDLVSSWSREYDYVILDTPPLLVAPDAAVLSRISDGLVLVSRLEVLGRNSAQRVKEDLSQLGANILGLVINGINSNDSSYFYGYYQQFVPNSLNVDTKLTEKVYERMRYSP